MLLGLAACHGSNSNDEQAASEAPLSTSARFGDEMSKEGCKLLTAKMVSATFAVPADALKQTTMSGCYYRWNNDQETLETGISLIQVHKSEAAAAKWFDGVTANVTAEEMKALMKSASGQLDKQEELDTELKKTTAKKLLSTVDTSAINFEDLADIGDEARVKDKGIVYVRVANLTFIVSAYKGARKPPLDMQGVEIKRMAEVIQEDAAMWATQTAPQRRQDATRLAVAITAGM